LRHRALDGLRPHESREQENAGGTPALEAKNPVLEAQLIQGKTRYPLGLHRPVQNALIDGEVERERKVQTHHGEGAGPDPGEVLGSDLLRSCGRRSRAPHARDHEQRHEEILRNSKGHDSLQ
jgi:hypothetical protein